MKSVEKLEAEIKSKAHALAQAYAREKLQANARAMRERKIKQRADAMARRADAHRKIELGGLVIAANAQAWNPADIVGALLAVASNPAVHRQSGIACLSERARKRPARATSAS